MITAEAFIIGVVAGFLLGIAATLSFQSTEGEVRDGWECPACATEMQLIPILGSKSLRWNCPKCNPWVSLMNKILVDLNDVINEIRNRADRDFTYSPIAQSDDKIRFQDWADRLADLYEKLVMEDKIRHE